MELFFFILHKIGLTSLQPKKEQNVVILSFGGKKLK